MATASGATSVTNTELDPDMCSVCLDTYNDPRFLPCFHTFCSRCIEDVCQKQAVHGAFPCPHCRKPTVLPPEGVTALQRNFYLHGIGQPKDAGKAYCKTHFDVALRYYCVVCEEAVCSECRLGAHRGHVAMDLHEAVQKLKHKLTTEDQHRVMEVADNIHKQLDVSKNQRQQLTQKEDEAEKKILDQHAKLVAQAGRLRDEALNSLRGLTQNALTAIDHTIKQQETNVKQLLDVQEHLLQTVSMGTTREVIAMAKVVKTVLQQSQSSSRARSLVRYPQVVTFVGEDAVVEKAGSFLGTVAEVQIGGMGREVTVMSRFRGSQDEDSRVFSLCHVDEDPPVIFLSYDNTPGHRDQHRRQEQKVSVFQEGGQSARDLDRRGRLTCVRFAKGQSRLTKVVSRGLSTFTKSSNARPESVFKLHNNFDGTADVWKINASEHWSVSSHVDFRIAVGPHRAIDMDEEQKILVVVEESREESGQRRVLMYQRPRPDPIRIYTPPTPSFQPSDVCFFTLGRQQVLLVTDEASDSIHVVSIEGNAMTFKGHLVFKCPLLVKPTAINVDAKGRLWVACQGSSVVCISVKLCLMNV